MYDLCGDFAQAFQVSSDILNNCVASSGPFFWHGLTLIPTWISNYICYKMWDEIPIHS